MGTAKTTTPRDCIEIVSTNLEQSKALIELMTSADELSGDSAVATTAYMVERMLVEASNVIAAFWEQNHNILRGSPLDAELEIDGETYTIMGALIELSSHIGTDRIDEAKELICQIISTFGEQAKAA